MRRWAQGSTNPCCQLVVRLATINLYNCIVPKRFLSTFLETLHHKHLRYTPLQFWFGYLCTLWPTQSAGRHGMRPGSIPYKTIIKAYRRLCRRLRTCPRRTQHAGLSSSYHSITRIHRSHHHPLLQATAAPIHNHTQRKTYLGIAYRNLMCRFSLPIHRHPIVEESLALAMNNLSGRRRLPLNTATAVYSHHTSPG